jgi:hypothetical protein
MGILLSAGILNRVREQLSGQLSGTEIQDVAAHVANGDSPTALRNAFPRLTLLDSSGSLVPSAVARGFGLVTLYGGIAVWVLATASLIVFGGFRRSKVPHGSPVADCGRRSPMDRRHA